MGSPGRCLEDVRVELSLEGRGEALTQRTWSSVLNMLGVNTQAGDTVQVKGAGGESGAGIVGGDE